MLKYALEFNKKSTAVVSLLRKCNAAWEHSNISALIDLCGESDVLLVNKEYVERHPVHFAANVAADIAILKPVIRELDAELFNKDEYDYTVLDRANLNPNPAVVVSFMTEAVTAEPFVSPDERSPAAIEEAASAASAEDEKKKPSIEKAAAGRCLVKERTLSG